MTTHATVKITPKGVEVNGKIITSSSLSLNDFYRKNIGDYPKFFKMDGLCKIGFVGAEILLKDLSVDEKNDIAIVLFNRSGSLTTDRNYVQTIRSNDNYFPSPALFVYTLANIVTGEIAIRHQIYGESSFYVMQTNDKKLQNEMIEGCFLTSSPSMILSGWVEYENEDDFFAEMNLLTK